MLRYLPLSLIAVCVAAAAVSAGSVVFLGPDGTLKAADGPVPTFQDAAAILVAGPDVVERLTGLSSALPAGAALRAVSVSDGVATVDLGGLGSLSDLQVDSIQEQFLWTADSFGLDVRVLADGEPISSVRPAEVLGAPRPAVPGVRPAGTGPLAGRSITVSPGHGYYWTGSYYTTQRGITCTDHQQEDLRNQDLAAYLVQYLQQDGAAIRFTREPDRSRGNHPLSGKPWWQMCAPFYLYDKGYPQWVYSAITNSIPGDPNYTTTQVDDDRRSRPEASNYDSTDLYLAIHTNAFQGNCYGTSCPTGIEMYADAAQLGGFFNQSLSLASKSQTAIYAAVRATYSASYPCRNNCVPRTNQQFTEIHYPRRPACLLELGFHDSCDTDVIAQKDPVYTSSAMWGYYKGVCDYFGVTPTWDLRSYEVVSSNIPTIVKGGSTFDLHITLRNRGCAWTEQRQFRLGAVNNSDPFTKTIRYTVPDTIGPGETVTFTIPMTTPLTDLALYTDWRMVQDERNAWFGPGIFGVVQVDSSPPTSPGPVDDGGPAQFSTTSLTASWQESTDAKTGIARYEYRVTERDGPEVLGWQSAGLQTSVTIPVSLTVGKTYQVWVKAIDSFGWETEPIASPGVTVVAQVPSRIGEARAMQDGTPVLLEAKVVSAKFADCFYIQEGDRSAGIRVEGSVTAEPGETVTVSGTMSTVDGDRRIVQPQVSGALAALGTPTPLAVAGHALGGGYMGPLAPGVANGFGLTNLGLLVRVYGMVSASGPSGFRVYDGSLPDDGSGAQGIWIDAGAFHKPETGAFALVTGVSSVQPGTNLRQVRVARDSDISP